jgi:hypothetical protein
MLSLTSVESSFSSSLGASSITIPFKKIYFNFGSFGGESFLIIFIQTFEPVLVG